METAIKDTSIDDSTPTKSSLEENEDAALRKMQKARSELLLSHPFFGSIALKLELKSDKHCDNLWTDGKTLAFNPNFISMLSHDHIMASQAHEILHIACNHHIRRNGRDIKLWNRACDYAINNLLVEAGFTLPENYFKHDKAYDNMSVDEIYVILGKMYEHEMNGGAESSQVAEQTTQDENASAGGSVNLEEQEEGQEEQKKGAKEEDTQEKESQAEQKNKAASQNNEEMNSSSQQNIESEFFGEIKDHPLLADDKQNENKENNKKAEQESLLQITQAMQSAENHGNIPMGLLRLYNTRIRPKLDWQSLLQRFIENCNDGDYTWSMPNRRYISQDIYLPSRKEPRIPVMALAIDASGSVDNTLLSHFCAELENILESYDSSLFIMYHDTKVQRYECYSREDRPLKLSVQGGGGTDYRHIPEFLEQQNIHPACLLWFTDFECDLFPEEPSYPVLWISDKNLTTPPPFGDAICIS